MTTREIAVEGFTTKNRDWNAVEVLEKWREAWAQDASLALELTGHGERIDHLTPAMRTANKTVLDLHVFSITAH